MRSPPNRLNHSTEERWGAATLSRWGASNQVHYSAEVEDRIMRAARQAVWLLLGIFAAAMVLGAQSQPGPIAPKPGVQVQQAAPDKTPKIVAVVRLVNTPVTVHDQHGEMVTDLDKKDFRVFDDGVEQAITHLDMGGDPLSLVLLVENSSRVEPLLPAVRKAGIVFTQTVMGPSGEAAVLAMNDSIDKLVDFTGDSDRIERAITRMKEGTSGLRLFDGMSAAVEMLQSRPMSATGGGRRRVILVLSEALDRGSERGLGEVLKAAQLANVTIYSVGLSTTAAEMRATPREVAPQITPPGTFGRPPIPGTPQTPTTEAQRDATVDFLALALWAIEHAKSKIKDHPLEVAAVATGGMHLATFKDRSIETALDQVGGELHSQYTLAYRPTGVSPVGYHEIKVEVMRERVKVRARPGYYLEPPQS
jgi:VWFA-related protein